MTDPIPIKPNPLGRLNNESIHDWHKRVRSLHATKLRKKAREALLKKDYLTAFDLLFEAIEEVLNPSKPPDIMRRWEDFK